MDGSAKDVLLDTLCHSKSIQERILPRVDPRFEVLARSRVFMYTVDLPVIAFSMYEFRQSEEQKRLLTY